MSFTLTSAQTKHSSFKARYVALSSSGYKLTIQNITQLTDRTIDFDVYLQDTDPLPAQTFEISSAQLGLLFNLGISTGTLSLTMNNTGSVLVASGQQFPSSGLLVAPAGAPNQVLLRVSGRSTTAGLGAIISKVGIGSFLSHFTITSTTAWVTGTYPNLIFLSDQVLSPLYATRVNQYVGTTDTPLAVTPGVTAIVVGNPVLNFGTGFDQNPGDLKIDIYARDKSIFVNCSQKAKQVYIYNTLGSLVMMQNDVTGLKRFHMENNPNAYYFVKVVTENNVYSEKVLLK
jgi:hypothetical protein